MKQTRRWLFLFGLQGLLLFCLGFLIFGVLRLHPFGNRSFLHNDLWSQYVTFARSDLTFGPSVRAFNLSFDGTLMYYAMSPFLFIYRLFSDPFIGMSCLIFTKLWAGAASMLWVLRRKFMDDWTAFGFAFIYLSFSWLTMMVVNPIWLDVVYVLPLLAYGLLDVLNGKWSVLFVLSFAWICWVNFAMGLMCGIFVALFYVTFSKLHHGRYFESFWLMVHVLVTTAFLVLPYIVKVRSTIDRASGSDAATLGTSTQQGLMAFLMVLVDNARLFVTSGQLTHVTVNAGLGLAGLFLLYNLWTSRHRHVRVVLLLLLSLGVVSAVPLLDFVFSGMIVPIGNPARYGFAFMTVVFFVLVDAYRDGDLSFSRYDLIFYFGLVGLFVGCGLLFLSEASREAFYPQEYGHYVGGHLWFVFVMTVLCCLFFVGLYIIYKRRQLWFWSILGVCSLAVNLFLIFSMNINAAATFGTNDYEQPASVIADVKRYEPLFFEYANTKGYERLDVDLAWGSNMALHSSYPVGTQLYSSGVPSTLSPFFSHIGLLGASVSLSGHTDIGFLNNFLNTTLLMRRADTTLALPILDKSERSVLYSNPYHYGVGFVYDDKPLPNMRYGADEPQLAQQELAENMNQVLSNVGYTGEPVTVEVQGMSDVKTTHTIEVKEGYDYVLFVSSDYEDSKDCLEVNGQIPLLNVFEHTSKITAVAGKITITIEPSERLGDSPYSFGVWVIPHESTTFQPKTALEVQPDGSFLYPSSQKESVLVTMVDSPTFAIKINGQKVIHQVTSTGFVSFVSSGNPEDVITIDL